MAVKNCNWANRECNVSRISTGTIKFQDGVFPARLPKTHEWRTRHIRASSSRTGVLPGFRLRWRNAEVDAAEDAEKTEDNARSTVIETESRKPADFRGTNEHAKAIWT